MVTITFNVLFVTFTIFDNEFYENNFSIMLNGKEEMDTFCKVYLIHDSWFMIT